MGKKPFLMCLVIILAAFLPACRALTVGLTGEPTTVSPPPSASPPTQAVLAVPTMPVTDTPAPEISLDTLKNFTYTLDDFDMQVTFEDGVYEDRGENSFEQHHGQLIEPVAFGDLDDDGRPDAAVILAVNTGGSGTFYYLMAMLNQDGAPEQAASAWVGDRQVVNDLHITDGKIILDFLTQGPNDGLCCPSEHRLRIYALENGELVVDSDQMIE